MFAYVELAFPLVRDRGRIFWQDGACKQAGSLGGWTFSQAKRARVEESEGGRSEARTKSVAFRLSEDLIHRLDVMAARAAVSRVDVFRVLLEGEPLPDTPVIACLGRLVHLHHRLDRDKMLDPALRESIAQVVCDLAELARQELGR